METQEQRTEGILKELYKDRALEEKRLSFDQWKKVMYLRYQTQKEREEKQQKIKEEENREKKRLRVGDKVRFTYVFEGRNYTFTGHIVKLDTLTVDVKNAIGLFKSVPKFGSRRLYYVPQKNLSNIQIPEELKEVDTRTLLRKFRYYRAWERPSYIYDSYPDFLREQVSKGGKYEIVKGISATLDEMRAELSTREHVFSTVERKIQQYLSEQE